MSPPPDGEDRCVVALGHLGRWKQGKAFPLPGLATGAGTGAFSGWIWLGEALTLSFEIQSKSRKTSDKKPLLLKVSAPGVAEGPVEVGVAGRKFALRIRESFFFGEI